MWFDEAHRLNILTLSKDAPARRKPLFAKHWRIT
jgi:hypothetical protein